MPQIHRISLPTPFPIGPVNAYLLPDEPATLVDTGPKTPDARAALEAALAAAGLRIPDIKRIILTHGHTDHFGQAAALAEASGARILAHPGDSLKFAGDRSIVDGLLGFLGHSGAPPMVVAALREGLRGMRSLFDPLLDVEPLGEGTSLRGESGEANVLHTPGHSAGHVCLVYDGQIIAGDVLLQEISTNPIVEFDSAGRRTPSLPLLIDSLTRLATLDPGWVFPGHGDPFGPAEPRITTLLEHHHTRQDEVFALLSDEPQSAFALAQTLFPGVDSIHVMLGISEVVGHLDILIAQGRAEETEREGILCYRRTATHAVVQEREDRVARQSLAVRGARAADARRDRGQTD